uniref:Battenin n=1 Tax=Heterorhabditis bacteriophora TaxID=37862 RepID=A0A1I7W666_HETBA
MAGFAGTFSYAALTDVHLAALTPSTAMLSMLVVPLIFVISGEIPKSYSSSNVLENGSCRVKKQQKLSLSETHTIGEQFKILKNIYAYI